MNTRLRNYLSCFGPQFVKGISILAENSDYERKPFVKSIRPLPNFFAIARQPLPKDPRAKRVRRAVWLAITLAWAAMILIILTVHIPLFAYVGLAVVVSLIAPHVLLAVATVSLRR